LRFDQCARQSFAQRRQDKNIHRLKESRDILPFTQKTEGCLPAAGRNRFFSCRAKGTISYQQKEGIGAMLEELLGDAQKKAMVFLLPKVSHMPYHQGAVGNIQFGSNAFPVYVGWEGGKIYSGENATPPALQYSLPESPFCGYIRDGEQCVAYCLIQ
jgi:hypothetical protein